MIRNMFIPIAAVAAMRVGTALLLSGVPFMSGCYRMSTEGNPIDAMMDGQPDIPTDTSSDASIDRPVDPAPDDADHGGELDLPAEGEGTIVPEGDGTLFQTDSGEDLDTMMGAMMPVAFSESVYAILMAEDIDTPGIDRVGCYRLAPGGTTLGTTWVDTVSGPYSPSICWSGEDFLAVFAGHEEGIRLLTMDVSGTLVRPAEVLGSIDDGAPNEWMVGDPTHVFCLDDGPMVVDFTQQGSMMPVDYLYPLTADGRSEADRLEIDLPMPGNYDGRPTCTSLRDQAACLTGWPPTPPFQVFFFDKDGPEHASEAFPDFVDFYHGYAIAAAGDAVAVIWTDLSRGRDKAQLGYALVRGDGHFIVQPMSTGIMILDTSFGMAAASSGNDLFVVGIASTDGDRVSHAYLIDLLGNRLDGPITVDAVDGISSSAAVFWEGDAYAVLWPKSGGIMYRRFRVE